MNLLSLVHHYFAGTVSRMFGTRQGRTAFGWLQDSFVVCGSRFESRACAWGDGYAMGKWLSEDQIRLASPTLSRVDEAICMVSAAVDE
jgi:hypothetical protein